MKLDKLKGKLTEKKRTYKECADYLNMSLASFMSRMSGKIPFKIPEAVGLGKYLEFTQEEFIDIFL